MIILVLDFKWTLTCCIQRPKYIADHDSTLRKLLLFVAHELISVLDFEWSIILLEKLTFFGECFAMLQVV